MTRAELALLPDEYKVAIQYRPRHYFTSFHKRTQRFACIVAHRRAGKTVACIHDLQRAAISNSLHRPRYAYIAPTYTQAKSAAFDYLVEAAAPIIPDGASVNKSELRVDYPNGAQVRLFGADNYNALRGLRLDGAVLDEVADFDPRAWPTVIRPALSDRQGFAVFIGTPRGHNHFYDLWTEANGDSAWFTAALKASELVPANGRYTLEECRALGLIHPVELEANRKNLSPEEFNQEYECDFEAAIKGAYYGKQMAEAAKDGRIGVVDHDPAHQVFTAWDIGGDRDATAIWFFQLIGRQVCLIDYYEGIGSDSAPYAKLVLEKDYSYAQHFLPHDAGPNRTGIDKNYSDFLHDHGLRNITVLPVGIREHGINTARLLLPRCYFDGSRCHQGIEALKMYRAEYNDKTKVLSASPVHDWASHGADSFRYLAVALDKHIVSRNFTRKIVYPNIGVA